MYDDCPDHGLPGITVCSGCVRPLCRKCKVTGSRCAECRAAAASQDTSSHVPGRAGAGNGKLVVGLVLIILGTLALTWQGCPGLPKDIVWLK